MQREDVGYGTETKSGNPPPEFAFGSEWPRAELPGLYELDDRRGLNTACERR